MRPPGACSRGLRVDGTVTSDTIIVVARGMSARTSPATASLHAVSMPAVRIPMCPASEARPGVAPAADGEKPSAPSPPHQPGRRRRGAWTVMAATSAPSIAHCAPYHLSRTHGPATTVAVSASSHAQGPPVANALTAEEAAVEPHTISTWLATVKSTCVKTTRMYQTSLRVERVLLVHVCSQDEKEDGERSSEDGEEHTEQGDGSP